MPDETQEFVPPLHEQHEVLAQADPDVAGAYRRQKDAMWAQVVRDWQRRFGKPGGPTFRWEERGEGGRVWDAYVARCNRLFKKLFPKEVPHA